MRGHLKTVLVSNTVHINTRQIPAHIGQNLAQAALTAIQRDYRDPVIQADYRRWQQERERRDAGETADG